MVYLLREISFYYLPQIGETKGPGPVKYQLTTRKAESVNTLCFKNYRVRVPKLVKISFKDEKRFKLPTVSANTMINKSQSLSHVPRKRFVLELLYNNLHLHHQQNVSQKN